jgi:hypothetical protein
VTSGDVDAALPALATVPPSQLAQGMTAARQAASQGFDQLHDELAANPPAMKAPSGLPRAAAPPRGGEGEEPRVTSPTPVSAGVGEQPRIDTRHQPSTVPLPAARVSTAAVDRAPEDRPEAVAQAAQQAIAAIPESDESVDTSAGERPRVVLTGEADPALVAEQEGRNRQAADEAWASTAADMRADEGENAIYPTVPAERIAARIVPTKLPAEGAPLKGPAIDPEIAAGFDRTAGEVWGEKVAKAQRDQMQAREKKEADERAQREETALEIQGLEQQTAGEQTAAQLKAKEDVAAARAGWNTRLAAADKTYTAKATSLHTEYQGKVDATEQQADAAAQAKLNAAEAEAAEKQRGANAEVAEKKQAAEEESEGFWASLKSGVKAFISTLKDAVNAVFDALRKAVKFIIEQAKKAAVWIIEQARRAIVGLIKAFGAALLLAADVFLAAFPEARKWAKGLIRRAVSGAVDVVNQLAEALKAGVSALLDALGAALDFVLALYQKAYNLILDAVEFIAIGLIEIMKRIGYLIDSAKEMPSHFESAAWEELLGMDISKPLPIEGQQPSPEAPPAQEGSRSGEVGTKEDLASFPGGGDTGAGASALLAKREYTASDIAVEPVTELESTPELEAHFPQAEGEETDLGEINEPGRTIAGLKADLLGTTPGASGTTGTAVTPTPAAEGRAKEGPAADLAAEQTIKPPEPTRAGRAKWIWEQMKTTISEWFAKNWWKLLLGMIAAITGLILLNIVTGGAIMAALPILMQVMTVVFVGIAVIKIAGHVKDYLVQGWAKQKVPAAMSLAKALAIGAIEIAMALGFRLLGAALKVAVKAVAVAAKGVTAAARGAVAATKAAVKLVGKGAQMAIKGGKFAFQGLQRTFLRGIKSLRELAARLFSRFRFRGFKLKRSGMWIEIWAVFNPGVLVARLPVRFRRLAQSTLAKLEQIVETERMFVTKAAGTFEKVVVRATKAKEAVESIASRLASRAKGVYGKPDQIRLSAKGLIEEVEEVKFFGPKMIKDLGDLARKNPAEFIQRGLGPGKFIQIGKHVETIKAIDAAPGLVAGTAIKGVSPNVKFVVTLPKFTGAGLSKIERATAKKAMEEAVTNMQIAWKAKLGVDVTVRYSSHTTTDIIELVKALLKP